MSEFANVTAFQFGQPPLGVITLDIPGATSFTNLDELSNMTTLTSVGGAKSVVPTLPASVTTLNFTSNEFDDITLFPTDLISLDLNANLLSGVVDLTVFVSMTTIKVASNDLSTDGGMIPQTFPPNVVHCEIYGNPQIDQLTLPLPVSLTYFDASNCNINDPAHLGDILTSLSDAGQSDGYVDLRTTLGDGLPAVNGLDARTLLQAAGWQVFINGFDSATWTPNTAATNEFGNLAEFRWEDPVNVTLMEFVDSLNTISDFDLLPNLNNLTFAAGNLTTLGDLPGNLIYLQAYDNSLTDIEAIWNQCPLLEEFYMTNNDFAGGIPDFPTAMFAIELNGNGPFTNIGTISVPCVYLIFTDCGFDESNIDDILQQLVDNSQNNGELDISGTNADPSGAGATNITTLQSRGWTVTTN